MSRAHADGFAHDGGVAAMGEKGIAAHDVAGDADVLRRDRHLCATRRCRLRPPSRSEMAWANNSARSRIRLCTRPRSAALLCGELADQPAKARRAASTAASTSCALPNARLCATGSSVDGSMTLTRSCPAGRIPLAIDEDPVQMPRAGEVLDDATRSCHTPAALPAASSTSSSVRFRRSNSCSNSAGV